jgi:hypothetical protein
MVTENSSLKLRMEAAGSSETWVTLPILTASYTRRIFNPSLMLV